MQIFENGQRESFHCCMVTKCQISSHLAKVILLAFEKFFKYGFDFSPFVNWIKETNVKIHINLPVHFNKTYIDL